MPEKEKQKSVELQKFEETLSEYGALVSVDKDESNPPDYYELSFRVPGYAPGPDGQPIVSKSHRISINIPLGYPVTCPLVKPLTPLFHPNVNGDSYGVVTSWTKIGSLSELVVFIGKMICGEVYNDELSINQEAADWYKDNPQKIKLGVFEPRHEVSSEVLAILDEIVPDPPAVSEINNNEAMVDEVEAAGEQVSGETVLDNESDEQETESSGDLFVDRKEEAEYSAEVTEEASIDEQEKINSLHEERELISPKPKTFSLSNLLHTKALVGFFCLAIVSLLLVIYFHDQNILKESSDNWQLAQSLINNKNFKQALETAERVKAKLSDVYIMTGDREKLVIEIDSVLVSSAFVEGLHGKANDKGTQEESDNTQLLQEIEAMVIKARSLREEGNLVDAIKNYEKAQHLAAASKGLDLRAGELQQEVISLRLKQAILEGEIFEKNNKFSEAAEIYKSALDIVSSGSEKGSPEKRQVLNLYLGAVKRQLKMLKQTVNDDYWRQAVEILSNTQKVILGNLTIISEKEKQEFELLFVKSQLDMLLYEAKQAYENGAWDLAIKKYNKALLLFKSKKRYISNEFKGAEKTISKTLLMTKVAKGLSLASASEKKNDPSGAVGFYRAVIRMLNGDPLGGGVEFQDVVDNAQSQIVAIEDQLMINEKIAWLKDNYISIFKKYYPSVNENYLSSPVVTLIKKEHDKLVFHLSCVEKTHGSSARLMLDYVNLLKDNKWDLYVEK
ncbi:MAG: ubiquitin-conjugating enzyme E2 [Desulfobulbaceae bacterium]|nr:ubiquitin-conjugating enzyme E2 [Desulfobulbaceae bacterium]